MTMVLGPQEVGVADTPLNETVLVPCVAPKPPPLITTDCPAGPAVGLKFVILGNTVKGTPLLPTPPTITRTVPVVPAAGTGATMFVALQLIGVAVVVPNHTVLVPCDAPKFVPAIVTEVPTMPDVGLTPVMFGGGGPTVKVAPLLTGPPRST